MTVDESLSVYRIIDANLNRLREALRVVEEYFRFIKNSNKISKEIKIIRHSVRNLSESIDQDALIAARDSLSDPFASGAVGSEMERANIDEILVAAMKRSQEASRVLEEYLKLLPESSESEKAKRIRFALYTFEKQIVG